MFPMSRKAAATPPSRERSLWSHHPSAVDLEARQPKLSGRSGSRTARSTGRCGSGAVWLASSARMRLRAMTIEPAPLAVRESSTTGAGQTVSVPFRVNLTHMNIQSATTEPRATTPSALPFARSLSRGDLEAATACFARDGCLITPDATAIHGRERIRPVLAQLIARGAEIEVELSSAIGDGDVMLARERWRIRTGRRGARVEQRLSATLVLRQIGDAWKLADRRSLGLGPSAPLTERQLRRFTLSA